MKSGSRTLNIIINELGLYNGAEFTRVHEYEQQRSTRSRIVFAYIILDVNLDIIRGGKLKKILAGIIGKMRTTDHIGWMNTNQIGIILPDTDEKGAQGFLKNIEPVISGVIGINIEDINLFPSKRNAYSAVAASIPQEEYEDISEAEEITIIPFSVAE